MSYDECLRDAMRLTKSSRPDEKSAHLARSILKMKNKYLYHCEKKQNHSTMMITEAPPRVVEAKHKQNICQSITLRGKACQFKASCGDYCKKHSLNKTNQLALGRKI
jgi:hypothetical protein